MMLFILTTKYMAKAYLTDGRVLNIQPNDGKAFTYEELRGIVEGLVQIVSLPDGNAIVVNEEGKLINLPVNEKATEYWKQVYPIEKYPVNNDELIVGNALVATPKELGEEDEEPVSNCCGAPIIENTDMCSDCKEHCIPE
jgi:hypothetical protein